MREIPQEALGNPWKQEVWDVSPSALTCMGAQQLYWSHKNGIFPTKTQKTFQSLSASYIPYDVS